MKNLKIFYLKFYFFIKVFLKKRNKAFITLLALFFQ